jgi:hypothetical protein
MRALRSIHNAEFSYVSVPITSGKCLYDSLSKNPQLKRDDVIDSVIAENYNRGVRFVEQIKKTRNTQIIHPAEFACARQSWGQDYFQAPWLSVIGELCSDVNMIKDWEYSNGCTEELTHAYQLRLGIPRHNQFIFFNTKKSENGERERMKNIAVYDHKGVPISIDDAVMKTQESIRWIDEHGFDSKRLKHCQELLCWTRDMLKNGFYQ